MMTTELSPEDVYVLEEVFAYLTPHGWALPAWLQTLKTLKGSPC